MDTWHDLCEKHPDHQTGMITNQMIQDRMQEEIDGLREELAQVASGLLETVTALKYVGGIVERGRGYLLTNDESVAVATLEYVRGLESSREELAVSEIKSSMKDLEAFAATTERDNWKQRADRAESDVREMVAKAAANKLDGYRELGARCAELETDRDGLREELAQALGMIAQWCVDIDVNGTGWDDWDRNFKDAMYRDGPLREKLDAAIAAAREERDAI